MVALIDDLSEALLIVRIDGNGPGWNMLRTLGAKATTALQSRHPRAILSLVFAFANQRSTPSLQQIDTAFQTLLKNLALEILGPQHPIPLLIDAKLHEEILPHLIDAIYDIIDLKYIRNQVWVEDDVWIVEQLRLDYGWALLEQEKHADLERFLASFHCEVDDTSRDPSTKINVLVLHAWSLYCRGFIREADKELVRVWRIIEQSMGKHSYMMLEMPRARTKVNASIGNWEICEELSLWALDYLQTKGSLYDGTKAYFIYCLRHVYSVLGKSEPLHHLTAKYSEFLM